MHAGWEQEAVVRTREGHPEAFAELVHRFDGPIHHAVFRIVGDHDRADDITQQAFISAYEHLGGFDIRRRFFSWIYRIALNEALNARRRGWRQCALGDLEPEAAEPSPEDCLLTREREDRVRRVLRGLPAKYQVLVTLRYYLEFPYGEIADTLGLPETTVKARLHMARGLLRRAWMREEADERKATPAAGGVARSRQAMARSA